MTHEKHEYSTNINPLIAMDSGHNKESNKEILIKAVNKVSHAKISYRVEWLEARNLKAENLKLYPVTGDGMQPVLFDGDYVMLDSSKTVIENYKIYGIMVKGEFRIRRLLIMHNGDLSTYCDYVNASKGNEIIKISNIEKDVLILGLAIHRQGSI